MDKLFMSKLKVSAIMTKNLITGTPNITVEEAVKRLIDNVGDLEEDIHVFMS